MPVPFNSWIKNPQLMTHEMYQLCQNWHFNNFGQMFDNFPTTSNPPKDFIKLHTAVQLCWVRVKHSTGDDKVSLFSGSIALSARKIYQYINNK